MSELKAHNTKYEQMLGEVYLKAEADKVIEYLQSQLELARTSAIKSLAQAQHEARHQKRKRCLAMAKWCKTSTQYERNLEAKPYQDFYERWYFKWLGLAAKLKETTDDNL